MKTKRLALTLASGLELRLFNVEAVAKFGRRISARNHSAMLEAEWREGIPFAELLMVSPHALIPLGPIWPQGMKYMEYLANH